MGALHRETGRVGSELWSDWRMLVGQPACTEMEEMGPNRPFCPHSAGACETVTVVGQFVAHKHSKKRLTTNQGDKL